MNTQQDETNNTTDKIEKKYGESLKRLVAIVGGKEKLHFPKRIPNDKLSDVIGDLFQEENDALLNEVKTGLRTILKQYAEMEKAFRDKEEEIAKLKKQKKEEFAKAAESLFNKIEKVGDVEKSYYDGLNIALGE